MNPHMLPKLRSDLIMAAAAGQNCTLRIASFLPGHRCSGTQTTVGAHLPVSGKGIGTKVTDMAVVFACGNCHDAIDGRDFKTWEYLQEHYPTAVAMRMLNALVETQAILLQDGIIVVPRSKIII